MIRKILTLIFLFSVFSFTQDKQDPNVELPDFVITGRDVISIQKAKKIKPDLVPVISQDFFKPKFSPDELGIVEVSNPVSNEINLYDSSVINNGYFDFRAGIYSLPRAKAFYSIPISDGILNTYFKGNNQLEYDVENSNRSEWNGGMDFSYFVGDNTSIFDGTRISLHGDYGSMTYKFFGSQTPALERSLYMGDFSFGVSNLLNRQFIIDAKVLSKYTSLPNENFTENLLGINAYTELNLSAFSLGADFDFENQFLTLSRTPEANNSNDGKSGYVNIKPFAGIEISRLMKIKFGFNYAQTNNSNFFAPFGAIGMNFNESFSLFAEYNPQAEFFSNGEFLRENNYNFQAETPNIFLKKKHFIKAFIKYEYDKYFEIDGGVSYYNGENLPYFTDQDNPGKFKAAMVNANSYSAFINLLFHQGPSGIFYGTAELNSTKNSDGKFVPYYPQVKASFVYGYDFSDVFSMEINLNYFSKQYTNIQNTNSIGSYFDPGIKFKFRLFEQFYLTLEGRNLFNNSNYRWNNYKEPPLNILGGFYYRW